MTGSNDFGLKVNWPKRNSTSYRSVNKYGGIKVMSERASIINGIGRTNVPFPTTTATLI